MKIRHSKQKASLHPAYFYCFSVKSRTTNQRIMISRCGPRWQPSNLVWQPSPAPTLATQPGSTSTGSTCNRFALYSQTLQPRARARLASSMGAAPPPHRPAPARQAPPPRPVSSRGTLKTTVHSQQGTTPLSGRPCIPTPTRDFPTTCYNKQ